MLHQQGQAVQDTSLLALGHMHNIHPARADQALIRFCLHHMYSVQQLLLHVTGGR